VSFGRLVLALSALPFAGIALAFLVAPETLAARVDVSLGSATADHDVRAVHGGLQLGCAARLASGAFRIALHAGEALGFGAAWLALRRLGSA
jgi:hypothetical protein